MTWRVRDSAGVECGTVRAASRDEALGKAQVKWGLTRYPFTAEEVRE